MAMARPRIVVTIPTDRLGDMFEPAALDRLRSLGETTVAAGTRAEIAARLPALLAEAEVVVTGWGAPPIAEALLPETPRLRLIAHAAGSIKGLIPLAALERGVAVCHAAPIIAEAVAEMTLLLMLACLRDVRRLDAAMRDGSPWGALPTGYAPRQLAGRAVGLVSGGAVARGVLRLLRPFDLTLRLHDPLLTPADAAALGVDLVGLDDLFRLSEIVSVHTPITPETRHLIGARQLALLPDGAVFINTARAWVVDQEALLAELQTGRISAGLDVFEPEPLPADSPFRRLENVILTPHQAGNTRETRARQGWATVEEIERFLAGRPLRHAVTAKRYAIMA
jgi:phosphoglycerate dehydrogenase-like enzyme